MCHADNVISMTSHSLFDVRLRSINNLIATVGMTTIKLLVIIKSLIQVDVNGEGIWYNS